MQPGDVVVTPEPASRTVLLGEVTGDYHYLTSPAVADYSHARPVTWRARISRDELSYGAKNSLGTQLTLSQPPHVAEFLRLVEAHATDEAVSALPQRQRAPTLPHLLEQVRIPANAAAPPRVAAEEFHTIPRPMLQLLAELDSGQLALPDFQRTFVWAPDETRELLVSMIRSFPAGALLFLQGGTRPSKRGPQRAHRHSRDVRHTSSSTASSGSHRSTRQSMAWGTRGSSSTSAPCSPAPTSTRRSRSSAPSAQPRWRSIEAQARTLLDAAGSGPRFRRRPVARRRGASPGRRGP